jgi:hypothetical protein
MLGHLILEYVIFELFLVRTYAWYCIVIIELLIPVVVIIYANSFVLFCLCSNLVLQVCNGLLWSCVGLGVPHEEEGQYMSRKDNICRGATGDRHYYVLLL